MKPDWCYVGTRRPEGSVEVVVISTVSADQKFVGALPLRLDICNHSPSGFEWGFGGSGPAQLALAILADHFGKIGLSNPDDRADRVHQMFKWEKIAPIKDDSFVIERSDIDEWLAFNIEAAKILRQLNNDAQARAFLARADDDEFESPTR